MTDMILVLRAMVDSLSYHGVVLLRVLLIPIIILLVLKFEVLPNANGKVLVRTLAFFYMIVYAFALMSVFRILIIGPQAIPQWGSYKLSKSSVYFVLYIVCLFIVLYLISYGIYSSLPYPISWVIFSIIKIYLLARVMLVFPAITVNAYFSFTSSWRRTKNHQTLMLLTAFIVVFLREFSKFIANQFLFETVFFNFMIEIATWVLILALLSETFKLVEMQNRTRLSRSKNSIIG